MRPCVRVSDGCAKVLLLGTKNVTVIGRPFIEGASVSALVEEQTQDAKVYIFKRRRRKHSQTSKGHRRKLTILRIKGMHPLCCFSRKIDLHRRYHLC